MSEISVTVSGSVAAGDVAVSGANASVSVTQMGGDRGPKGDTGPANSLSIGTVTTGEAGSSASATITGTAPNQTLSLVIPRGNTGAIGAAGANGQNIELQASGTHLQWRNVGAVSWSNLVSLAAITGPQGNVGSTGASVELRATATHIQWRPVGGSTWTDLVLLSAITGPQGAAGSTGAAGPAGPAGPANSLSVGTVTTGAPGSSASVTIGGTAPNQTLSLVIPRGDVGATGPAGATGAAGPANSLSIGTVTTGAPGSSASATIAGTAPIQTLSLSIPRGDTGATGPAGTFGTPQDINTITASYTLVIGDAGKLVVANSTASVTITVPADASVAFSTGTHIDVARVGTGTAGVLAASGVTVNATPGLSLRARYSAASLVKINSNAWLLVGDTS